MKHLLKTSVYLAALLAAFASSAGTRGETANLAEAIANGTVGFNIRARFEGVDQDNLDDEADAVTTRIRLNYKTESYRSWSGMIEVDQVLHFMDDFNSGGGTSPGKSHYPVVADPDGSDLNQLYLEYRPGDAFTARLGRQRILLDNQRFVGGVGWRQNEQTYDGITLTGKAFNDITLQYSYVGTVRRIFGERSPQERHHANTHLLNARVKLSKAWSVVPYYYHLNYSDDDGASNPNNSSATFGARLAGKLETSQYLWSLILEAATQSDTGNSALDYSESYLHADATLSLGGRFSVGLGFETLGGDGTGAGKFTTPMATLHKFQGWADKFLVTPPGGIEDIYITGKLKLAEWNLTAVYHDFSAENGSADYGTELDISIGRKLGKHYSLLFKGAFFSGDNPGYVDTNKLWVMFTASF